MTTQAIITLSLAVLALGLKPGPGMMMVMSQTMARGMSACFAFLGGFLLITLVYLLIAFVGFHATNLDLVLVLIMIKSAAAVYLIWFGIQGLQAIDLRYDENIEDDQSLFDIFVGAVVLTISNPLVIVFYAGILPTIIDINNMILDDMMMIIAIVLLIEGGLVLLYCTPLALFRKKIPIRFLKGLRVFSSIMMILIGLYIGYTAIGSEELLSVF